MSPSARKALGSLALLAYLAIFIIAAMALGERVLAGAPWWAAALYFALAGLIWIAPLKPLMAWMNKP
ncbi:MAG: DUF2842 domain-containing protein [Hyphomonadaceae bacterium]